LQRTPTPFPTATPTATATPIVYYVAEGETLSHIAVANATTVEEIEALNPGVVPEQLQIGQALQLPPPATAVFEGESGTPLPLQVSVGSVALYRTPMGSAWLLGEVVNEGAHVAVDVQVEVSWPDAAVAPVVAWATPSVLEPGGTTPFGTLLAGPVPDGPPSVSIAGGEALDGLGTHYLDLAASPSEVTLEEGQVTISGTVKNSGERTASQINVVVTLYDGRGRVSGYAQQWLDVVLAPGETTPFYLEATPPGEQTVDYAIVAQGLTQ
jgi:LysM repeat protein